MMVDSTGITDIKQNRKIAMILPSDLEYSSVIGQGNGGVVRKAFYRPTMQPVAVKIINVYDRDKRHQLYNELKQLKSMDCQ